MGRHGKPAAASKEPPDPSRRRFRRVRAAARRLWHLLPEEWRGWVWVRRQRWRAWLDRRYARRIARRIRDWATAREWDANLPKDPSCWLDGYDLGSYGVAAHLRSRLRQRGDLLPEHHVMEPK